MTPQADGTTRAVIAPILRDTYGEGGMVESLADHLAAKIDAPRTQPYADEKREDMIRNVCWDWMTGGSTAEYVAKKIEDALGAERDA